MPAAGYQENVSSFAIHDVIFGPHQISKKKKKKKKKKS
jgi:hypothetical protein